MDAVKNWALALVGLALILVGVGLQTYTKYDGWAVLLYFIGGLLVALNAVMFEEAATRGMGYNDYH